LMMAASAGYEASVKLLLRRGATLDACDKRGWTAVTHAAFNGWDTCLQMLGEKGASLDVRDFLGTTPAMRAALAGHGACLQQLAAHGADMCLKDNLGMEASVHARRNGHKSCARFLEKLGKEATLVRSPGATHAACIGYTGSECSKPRNPTLLPRSGRRIRRLGGSTGTTAKAYLPGFGDEGGHVCDTKLGQRQPHRHSRQLSLNGPYAPATATSPSSDFLQPLP